MKGKKVRWGCCSNPDLGVSQTQIWVSQIWVCHERMRRKAVARQSTNEEERLRGCDEGCG
ncbi:hypothetical protein SLEP1_g31536 [Rubroshorea leprosula]|uniref:Uncharacterized protein n=1 Tax=Rubroshorea leprosula TaxID=152421 RepID=A0AAV5KAW9_9ROSI|nr:hypothetical protein SLEP1_g31536 [Rubroshorea leprosula]